LSVKTASAKTASRQNGPGKVNLTLCSLMDYHNVPERGLLKPPNAVFGTIWNFLGKLKRAREAELKYI